MPTFYFAGQATFSGTWATTPAEAQNQSTPAKAKSISTWIDAASITNGDTVVLLGTYPLTLADTADYTASTLLANQEIPGGGTDRADNGAHGRNILFGNNSDGASSADGITFMAIGDVDGYNVDMRGATNIANRQSAALFFQGYDMVIDGFKIRCANYNYAQTGGVTPTVLGGTYVTDTHENCGIILRGAWGSEIKNCVVNGGTRACWGIKVQYRASATATTNANKSIKVHDCEVYNCGEGQIEVTGGAGINVNNSNPLPNNASIEVYNNYCHDGFWGEASWNAARYHGNLLAVYAGNSKGSTVKIYNNTISGECQDGLLVLAANALVYGNTISNIMPGFDAADTVNTFGRVAIASTLAGYASEGVYGWGLLTSTGAGNGIKCGLGQTYTDIEPAAWLGSGTWDASGQYDVDQLRPIIFKNIIDGFPRTGINTNGSGGACIVANEVRSTRGNRGISTASNLATTEAIWVANNYVNMDDDDALYIFDYINCFAFNNILIGGNAAVESGANNAIYGSNNLLDGTTSGTFLWSNNVSDTADYTWGAGPTSGGNCDGAGEWWGLLGARTPIATKEDLAGNRWDLSLPIGPRNVP